MSASQQAGAGRWHFWIDRGGTFTDIVARRPDGRLVTHKLLSEDPERYDDAALAGLRAVLGTAPGAPFPVNSVAAIRMGTTVATNALLERRGEPTVAAVTGGFRDVLRIGNQTRPKIFALHIELPEPLYSRVVEIGERVRADGTVERPLDLERARRDLQAAFDEGFRSLAIVLMHGYAHHAHEVSLAELAHQIGFTRVSASHQVSPLIKFVPRGDTTVVDAYLGPVLDRYLSTLRASLGDTRLMFMQSSGGLAEAGNFEARDAILSGPAGGVVGAARIAEQAGFRKIIAFDMGGTSTDVSHIDGAFERGFESEVAGVRLRVPMMRIHTVAAGGGSILHFDGSRMRVGPDSAGADPGPACYRRGGPLTVTDCNLLLGRIPVDSFPRVFGPARDQGPDLELVKNEFAKLTGAVNAACGSERSPEQVADDFVAVAVDNMARAIRKISIQRGRDVSEYVLVSFGGAGGQHACLVADVLGMERILIHPMAGVLSALGMGLADITAHREQGVEAPLDESISARLEAIYGDLEASALDELARGGVGTAGAETLRSVNLRYQGSDTVLTVRFGPVARMQRDFQAAHRSQFGFDDTGRGLVVDALLLEAVVRGETPMAGGAGPVHSNAIASPSQSQSRFFSGGAWHAAPVIERAALQPGKQVDGPVIIVEPHASNVIEPGWSARVTGESSLLLTRRAPAPRRAAVGTRVDPMRLEIFNNLFMSIAEEMGVVLRNTAHSVNMKERLDFSCAVFDGDGGLIANAPHMPVHLGSMGESVRAVIRGNRGRMQPGDVFALNAPYNGGTHLPDVTVVTPVFGNNGAGPLFYVGNRGHHADIGGLTPGSMPPSSHRIEEEGVLIDNLLLVSKGRFREAEVRALLASGPYPARTPERNIADLKAQIAANEKGAVDLKGVVDHYGLDVVTAYMGHVRDNAEESVRRVIDVLGDGGFETRLDTGDRIKVTISIDSAARGVVIDFSGTSPEGRHNFNAPAAVAKAAVLYVFRSLVDDDIPLNGGCLKPLKIIVPEGCLLNPRYPAAVVAGNVETSQVIVDALLGALGVLAASQGTMNNFTFGNAAHQYYETICGGTGAGADFDGTSAVHSHMTNSRLTDPEILELRYPVVVERFSIRAGSGGAGRRRGGDGVVRRIRFLEPMTAAILSNRRETDPFGLDGGAPGGRGVNRVERADGSTQILPFSAETPVGAGDVFIIETPGGGGFGDPNL